MRLGTRTPSEQPRPSASQSDRSDSSTSEVRFADHRPAAIVQRRFADAIKASPQQRAQRQAADVIHHSSSMQVQRRLLGLYGPSRPVIQRHGPELTLALGSGMNRRIWLHADPKYYEFIDRPGSYLAADQVTVDGKQAEIADKALATQVAAYFSGVLLLWRGITRQHPLWYEVRYLNILQPLGSGEMPNFATNKTSYIPFGHSLESARGVAMGRNGMGPGDDLSMVAGLHGPGGPDDPIEVGATIEVGVGHRGHRVAFYNFGEIQVYGPIDGITPQIVTLPRRDLPPAPAHQDEVAYVAEHGGKRHQKIEAALGVGGVARLQQIGASPGSRQDTALDLLHMRELMWASFSAEYASMQDADYASKIDSGANREGHAEYLVQILGGAERKVAVQKGMAAGVDFFWSHRFRSFTEQTGKYGFVWSLDTAKQGVINVVTPLEEALIGQVEFSFMDLKQIAPPKEDEPFTKEHVLGKRTGKVCHLKTIMNFSLTRKGPADIYRGFANELMTKVEKKARERGAYLIFLEPAKSNVRADPNTNVMNSVDPTPFYTDKHGYSSDAEAAVHNALVTERQFAGLEVDAESLRRQKSSYNLAMLGGILTKAL